MNFDPGVFARNLVYLRTKYALPQKSLARLSGISLPVLRLTERGEAVPQLTQERLDRLCAIFAVTPEQLLQQEIKEL